MWFLLFFYKERTALRAILLSTYYPFIVALPGALSTPILFSLRMELFVGFSQGFVGDVSVDLSGRDVGVAEEHLD